MNELLIKVKINNAAYLVDLANNAFRSETEPANMVLFNQCRYRDGKWCVLWNKKDNVVYEGLRKLSMPPYVSETCIDFLDNGSRVKRTILQTIGAVTDTIIELVMKIESEGLCNNRSIYN